MKSAGKARSNGLYRHIRTSKEIIRNLLNDSIKYLEITYYKSIYFKSLPMPFSAGRLSFIILYTYL